jgi:hypothetical protein
MQYNHLISMTYSLLHGITSFYRFCSPLGLATALPLFRVAGLHHPCSLLIVGDDAARLASATALQQRVTDKMAALQTTEKKAVETRACVHTITLLLEEDHASATALEVEATATVLQLTPTTASSSAPPPLSFGGAAAAVATLHMYVCGVHNSRSLVLTVMNPSSTRYAR